MEGIEKSFLNFVLDKMNMPGLKLIRVDEKGNKEWNSQSGSFKETKCKQQNKNHEKIFLIIASVVISTFYKGQEYPLNTGVYDIPNNAYLKDTNNELDKYVGVWKGEWNGKTLYLDLRKIKTYSKGNLHSYYKDEILGERKIIGANGTVEVDRISNFDTESPEFSGIFRSLKMQTGRGYIFILRICAIRAHHQI